MDNYFFYLKKPEIQNGNKEDSSTNSVYYTR